MYRHVRVSVDRYGRGMAPMMFLSQSLFHEMSPGSFDNMHGNIPPKPEAEAREVRYEQLRLALCRYHSIVGLRCLGYNTSRYEAEVGKDSPRACGFEPQWQ
jgi:hypothetical protein